MVAGRDFNGSVGWELVRGTVLRAGVSRVGEEAAERGAAGSSAAGGRGDLRRVSWHRARACPAAERRQARRRPPTCSVGGGLYWSSSSWRRVGASHGCSQERHGLGKEARRSCEMVRVDGGDGGGAVVVVVVVGGWRVLRASEGSGVERRG